MTDDSYLGKCDIQCGEKQMQIYEKLDPKYITDHIIYNVTLAKYLRNYDNQLLDLIFKNKLDLQPEAEEKIDNCRKMVYEQLIDSPLPHIKIFDNISCLDMGLPVRAPEGDEIKFFTNKIKIDNYLNLQC